MRSRRDAHGIISRGEQVATWRRMPAQGPAEPCIQSAGGHNLSVLMPGPIPWYVPFSTEVTVEPHLEGRSHAGENRYGISPIFFTHRCRDAS